MPPIYLYVPSTQWGRFIFTNLWACWEWFAHRGRVRNASAGLRMFFSADKGKFRNWFIAIWSALHVSSLLAGCQFGAIQYFAPPDVNNLLGEKRTRSSAAARRRIGRQAGVEKNRRRRRSLAPIMRRFVCTRKSGSSPERARAWCQKQSNV